MAVAAGKVQGRVAVDVGAVDGGLVASGGVSEEQLEDGVVAVAAGLHDGVAAVDVAAQDAGGEALGEEVDDAGVAGGGGEGEGGLLELVEGRGGILVAEVNEDAGDMGVAERGSEVEARVGQAEGRRVGVVDKTRVRLEDALDEEGVVGEDGAAEPSGRGDPERGVK